MKKIPKIFMAGLMLASLIVMGCTDLNKTNNKPKTLSDMIASAAVGDTIDLSGDIVIEPDAEYAIVKKVTIAKGDVKGGKFIVYASGVEINDVSGIDTIKIASEVGNGDFKLVNCGTVKTVVVNGGGSNSVHIDGTTVEKMTVNKKNVRVAIAGDTKITKTYVLENVKIEVLENSTAQIAEVVVSEAIQSVEIKGDVTVKSIVTTTVASPDDTTETKPAVAIKLSENVIVEKADKVVQTSIKETNPEYVPPKEIEEATISEEDKTAIVEEKNEAEAIPEKPEPVVKPDVKKGTIAGKALYSNSENHKGICVSIEKVENGRSVALTNSRAIADQNSTKNDGSYTFVNVEPGKYTVYASSPDSVEQAVYESIEVKAGETTTVPDMTLTGLGSISGTALHRNEGRQGMLVYIAGTSYQAKTDWSGKYEIKGVPARKEGYTVVAETPNGEYSASIENVVVNVGDSTIAETIVVWGTDAIKHASARAVDGGIYFSVSLPSYSSETDGTMPSLNVTESVSRVSYSWTNSNKELSHSFVFPFVEKGKAYTFEVWYGDYSYRVFDERVWVEATDGLGELSITNKDKVDMKISTNEKDSIVVEIAEAPELNDFGQAYTQTNSYHIYTSENGSYRTWLYEPERSLADERSMKFDIFDPMTYYEGWGAWRYAGQMKGYIWGHEFTVELRSRLALTNSAGIYMVPVASVRETAKGEPVQFKMDYSKGVCIDGSVYSGKWLEILKEKGLEFTFDNLPNEETINYGGKATEPKASPKVTLIYSYTEGEEKKTVEVDGTFLYWANEYGNKHAFVNVLEPIFVDPEKEDNYLNRLNPGTEYCLYPAVDVICTVKYETNGGEAISDRTFSFLTESMPRPTPTREGYRFTGWYSDAELTKPFEHLSIPVNEITLYAGWKERVERTLWEDEVSLDSSWDGDLAIVIPKEKFVDCIEGNKILISCSGTGRAQIRPGDWSEVFLESYPGYGEVEYTINSYSRSLIEQYGLVLFGYDVTYTKVVLTND